MKPKNIFILRHGESVGNENSKHYVEAPPYIMELTQNGVDQADKAGENLRKKIGNAKVMFYNSPLWRARETFERVAGNFDKTQYKFREDSRLRVQEWGSQFKTKEENETLMKARNAFGPYYFRVPGGEACVDVDDRIANFLEGLRYDFLSEDYPENAVFVTHGMPYRLIMKYYLGWSVEQFESFENPANCQIMHLKLNEEGIYEAQTELNKRNTEELKELRERELNFQ
jgi:broad specificity phosphatase PhoE